MHVQVLHAQVQFAEPLRYATAHLQQALPRRGHEGLCSWPRLAVPLELDRSSSEGDQPPLEWPGDPPQQPAGVRAPLARDRSGRLVDADGNGRADGPRGVVLGLTRRTPAWARLEASTRHEISE